jgi:hypothetical protein
MFLNWQNSTKTIPVVLKFRVGERVVWVSQAELARLSQPQRTRVRRFASIAR